MLACWSLSRRLEQAAALVARSGDLAGAVDAATVALERSVVRAGFAARALALECCTRPTIAERPTNRADAVASPPAAGSDVIASAAGVAEPSQAAGTAASPGQTGALGDYWRAQADATRQLDSLRALSLEPGLEWLARPLVGLRDAVLARMAAADDATRQSRARKDAAPLPRGQTPAWTPDDSTARPANGVAEPDEDAGASLAGSADPLRDSVDVLAGRLRDAAEDHRREVLAVPLAQAALDRRRRVAAALIGAILSPVLMLAARRRGSAPPLRPRGNLAPILEPVPSCPNVAEALPGAVPEAPLVPRSLGTTPALEILLVEDNAMVRFSMKMMLAELGHRVSAAADAAEAMRLAEADPDVLVTDLGLPDLDGLTLARRLRARRPGLRVVIASGRPGSVPDAVWLQKPFGLDGLRQAVEASGAPSA